ncbi:MAG: glycosyltransferase family 4 protein [Candidatus Hydrogenedentes bacterium]|nr:glycosyltransferase family 4 protein [Candidatus Hydrogenedentota bacterium]
MSTRIAVVGACPFPVPQGSQVFLKDTALTLQSHGYEVHLVVYGYGESEEDFGLQVHRSTRVPGARRTQAGPSLHKPLLDLLLVRTLRRVMRRHSIDVVLAHNYEGLLVALAARARAIVYQAHNAMVDELPHFLPFGRIAEFVGRRLDRTFPRLAQHVVAPHAGLGSYLMACGCTPARVSVLTPPANAGWFSDPIVSETPPPVVYTGNLDSYQNVAFLDHVIARVREQMPETRLLVATNDKRHVPHAEIIRTPDFDALKQVLSRDCVVVCPRVSWSGYPIKLLNAMAAGRAIVACRSAAHPLDHGHTGLIVDDNDEAAFGDAVVELLRSSEKRLALGMAARERVRTAHTPQAFAEALERIFERVLSYPR